MNVEEQKEDKEPHRLFVKVHALVCVHLGRNNLVMASHLTSLQL